MKGLLIILLLLPLVFVEAQITNSSVEKDYRYPQGTVTVAINSKNPSNVVIASDLNRIYVSLDSGATWQKKLILPENGVLGKSVLHMDRRGRFYLIANSVEANSEWVASDINGKLVTFQSIDNGMTWEVISELDETSDNPTNEFYSANNIVTGDFYVTWPAIDPENATHDILFSMASGAKNWSKPVGLIHSPGPIENFGWRPTPGPSGQVYVTWSSQERLNLDRTYNKGKMWLRNDLKIAAVKQNGNFTIDGYPAPGGLPVSGTDLSNSAFRGGLYLAWADISVDGNSSDILFTRSSNKGDTWSRPEKLYVEPVGKYQFAPALSLDQATGLLYITYLSKKEKEDTEMDVYLAWSLDGGSSFNQVKINREPVRSGNFSYLHSGLSIYAFQGMVCTAWVTSESDHTEIISSCVDYKDLGIK